ncbi:MAG: acetate--CoA ligase family protein [Candidatus Eisenbacteria sp.]|nr:acetate--CoA ligase family protein [Candidatus Eisenbacteria bacterium]
MTAKDIPSSITNRIDEILACAHREGREHLLEHEVYEILELLELAAPRHVFIRKGEAVDEERLSPFDSSAVVIKVVSNDILHKARVGGVQRAACDVKSLNATIDRMARDIPTHPSFSTPPEVAGFLLVEPVIYSEALGNESLIGFRENLAFGPLVSFSKGGSDAEHFARYYSPPNVKLVPLTLDECRSLIHETRIFLKYREEEKLDRVELLANAIYRISRLAHLYSGFNPGAPPFVFTEFEVNPFVFDARGRLIALDGLASFVKSKETDPSAGRIDVTNLRGLFKPQGLAVVGVSASDPAKMGNIIAELMVKSGRSDLYLLNVKGGSVTIRGKAYPLHKSLAEIRDNVDLVVVAVPAKMTPHVVRECKAKKVKAVILIPGGFQEVSGDSTLEQQISETLKGTGIRVVGPNCLGVIYAPDKETPGVNTFFIPQQKLDFIPSPNSNVALVTQSGAMGVTFLDQLRHAPYLRALVSYGNQLDVDPGDLVAYFNDDPSIKAIGVYVEGFRPSGGRAFFDAARSAGKPIVVYKAGRTEAGSRAAASHTASMTGDYEVTKAALLQAGVIVAEHIGDLRDLLKVFALAGDKQVAGRRVAAVTNAGFESTYAADSIGDLELASFTDETAHKLRETLPRIVSINPFLDLTPMANDEIFESCIRLLLADPNVDSLFISIVPHTTALTTGKHEMDAREENVAIRIIRQTRQSTKPIVMSVNAGDMYDQFVNTLEEGGVPTYPTAERAMQCLNTLVNWHLSRTG